MTENVNGTEIDEHNSNKLNDSLASAYRQITESVRYASRIQRSLLPSEDPVRELLADHFVLWEPRDVVGGDLYWIRREKKGVMIVLFDCTGHGVPGALMTTIAISALNAAFAETADPARLIARVHRHVKTALRQDTNEGYSDDGLELGVCLVEPERRILVFSGARFPLLIMENGEMRMIAGDKSGVGYRHVNIGYKFTNHRIGLKPGMKFYMYSDGINDQIGGPKRRGFGRKRINEILIQNQHLPMPVQKQEFYSVFTEYQGQETRRDDLSMVGFMPIV